jgi:hypothetical protein
LEHSPGHANDAFILAQADAELDQRALWISIERRAESERT